MCALTETWDVKTTRNGTSPLDIANRQNEFNRELSFLQQKRHLNIRTSETPRDDEGILDWLLRSVTAVPLGEAHKILQVELQISRLLFQIQRMRRELQRDYSNCQYTLWESSLNRSIASAFR